VKRLHYLSAFQIHPPQLFKFTYVRLSRKQELDETYEKYMKQLATTSNAGPDGGRAEEDTQNTEYKYDNQSESII
jgi:hypothetical protein